MTPSPDPLDAGTPGPQRPRRPDAREPLGPDPLDARAWEVPTSVPVAILTAIDPILRDSLAGGLMLDVAGTAELRYEIDVDTSVLRRIVVTAHGVLEDEAVELEHPCVSCAMREDAIPVLNRLASRADVRAIVLAPPISAEPAVVAGTLARAQGRWHLASAIAVLSAEHAIEDLLGEDTLIERGLQWATEDHRSVGEALAAQIEYSDLIVVDREADRAGPEWNTGANGAGAETRELTSTADCAGRELIEHLRAPEQLLVEPMHALDGRLALSGVLDHEGGTRRRDPRHVEPWGGPIEHGTWTLDLPSERPFHPGRLLENIELLGAGRMRGRGRFWVPDRPGTICQWDGAGGQVSIGAVMDSGRDLPTTHLVITGIDAADMTRVRDAFGRCLLTEEEWADGLEPWLDAEDHLAPWLGERSAVGFTGGESSRPG